MNIQSPSINNFYTKQKQYEPVRLPHFMNGSLNALENAIVIDLSFDQYDYTKEDALKEKLFYQNAEKIELSKADIDLVNAALAEKYAEKGIFKGKDFSDIQEFHSISVEMSFLRGDDIKEDINWIASTFAVIKDRINTEFSGKKRETMQNMLEEYTNYHKDIMAQGFADKVGGVFEENGVNGEKEHLYKSALAEIEKTTTQYSDFAKSNENYADINGADEAWLEKNNLYMSSVLRKAMIDNDVPSMQSASKLDLYTMDEMSKMEAFSKELGSYSQYVSGSTKYISTGNESEESLGMKLAELSLKGKIFNEYADVSGRVKNAVTKSIDNFTTSVIDKEQNYMDKWSRLQIRGYQKYLAEGEISETEANKRIAAIKKNFAPVDKDSIYAIINKVADSYEQTGDARKALMDGAFIASDTYKEKALDSHYDGIQRYDYDIYWNNFFTNKDKFYGTNVYVKKESGLDGIINNWNSFMKNISSDCNAFLKTNQLSTRA